MLAGLGLLPIALIGAWGIHASVNKQQAELERSMLGLSRALASAVDAELETTVDNVKALADSQALIEGDIAAFYEVARKAALAQNDWRSVILTDAAGRVLFKTARPFGAVDAGVVDAASLHEAMRTRQPVIGAVAKGPRNLAAVPTRVPIVIDGQLRHVLTAALAPDRVLRIFKNQKLSPGWCRSTMRTACGSPAPRTTTGRSPPACRRPWRHC